MASTNKTTNYNLSQFDGTDKPSWEADYNADMLSIDQNLKSVSDIASGASGDISSLDDRLTTAEGNISTNANDITALDGRLDAVESTQGTQGGDISSIQAEQIVQNTGIESATRLGYNLARPYDNTNVYSVGDYVLFNDTLYKCTTAILVGETFDPTKWLAIKATDEIAAGGYTLPTASANVLGGVKVGNNLNIDANGVLSASGNISFIDFSNDTNINDTFIFSQNAIITLLSLSSGGVVGTVSQYINHTDITPLVLQPYAFIVNNLMFIYCRLRLTFNIQNMSSSRYIKFVFSLGGITFNSNTILGQTFLRMIDPHPVKALDYIVASFEYGDSSGNLITNNALTIEVNATGPQYEYVPSSCSVYTTLKFISEI